MALPPACPTTCLAPQLRAEMKEATREAADAAARKVFAILGVDLDEPKDVEDFRKDLRFSQTMRRAADRGMMALVVALVGAVGAALWAGFVMKVGGK